MNKKRSIAIDGPAGAGKSTMARRLARSLRFIYVDTGALYRSIALFVLKQQADPAEQQAVAALLDQIRVELRYVEDEQRVFLNGEDVSEAIRQPDVSMAASQVAAIPEVRAFLMDLQRDMARNNNVVMDGRDIGTVVLPEADVKIYLTASAEERTRRRMAELVAKGMQVQYEELLEEIRQRDRNDKTRSIAPLKKADDAIEIDSTGIGMEETMEKLIGAVKERIGNVAV